MSYYTDIKGSTKWGSLTISYTLDPAFYNNQLFVQQELDERIFGTVASANAPLGAGGWQGGIAGAL